MSFFQRDFHFSTSVLDYAMHRIYYFFLELKKMLMARIVNCQRKLFKETNKLLTYFILSLPDRKITQFVKQIGGSQIYMPIVRQSTFSNIFRHHLDISQKKKQEFLVNMPSFFYLTSKYSIVLHKNIISQLKMCLNLSCV